MHWQRTKEETIRTEYERRCYGSTAAEAPGGAYGKAPPPPGTAAAAGVGSSAAGAAAPAAAAEEEGGATSSASLSDVKVEEASA